MTTNTILDLNFGDLFHLPNGKTRRFVSLRRSNIGEEVRAVTFEDKEGKRHEEPIGTRVAVTIVARDNEIRPYEETRGNVLMTRAETASFMIWPFSDSSERRSKALRVLSMDATASLRSEHFDTVAKGYETHLKRSCGVEFDDARSRHKTRNCLVVAEMVRDALAALEK